MSSKELGTPAGFLLPFTDTRSVTIQEMSIAVESRDANLVFGEFPEK